MDNNNENEEIIKLTEEELQGETATLENLTEEEEEKTAGGAGFTYAGTKYTTITLKPGKSKVFYGLNSYYLQLQLAQGSNLISTSYWGGRGGIKITRKSSASGTATVKYQEQKILSNKWYNGSVTVKCP